MKDIIVKLMAHAEKLAQWIPDLGDTLGTEDEDRFDNMWDEHEKIIKEAKKLLEQIDAVHHCKEVNK